MKVIMMERPTPSAPPFNQREHTPSNQIVPSNNQISDHRVITVEEHTFSHQIFPSNNKISDEERYATVVDTSRGLLLALLSFPVLKMLGIKLSEGAVIGLISTLVFCAQLYILGTTWRYPENNSIFDILFILLLSTALSFTVVILVSTTAAIIVLGLCGFVIGFLMIYNFRVIWNEDIVFSKGIQKLMALICFSWGVYVVICIVLYIKP